MVPQVLAPQEGAPARGARVAPLVRVAPRVPHQLARRTERPAAILHNTFNKGNIGSCINTYIHLIFIRQEMTKKMD